MYVDQVTDLLYEMSKIRLEPDESKILELTTKFHREILPKHLTIFETKLNHTNSGYLVGKGLTFADLFQMNILERLGDKKEEILNNFPTIKKHDKIIRAFPNIYKWLLSRPVTEN
jgi:glutathione S-transferase